MPEQQLRCSFCGTPMPQEGSRPAKGWAIRADGKVIWCPKHIKEQGDRA